MPRRRSPYVLLLAVPLLLLGCRKSASSEAGGGPSFPAGSLPDSAMTPGDVLTSDRATICQPGYTQTVRNVPSGLKAQVYREYKIASHQPGEYEVDHLISLELGGSNSLRNLWPQSYVTKPLNAHIKDALENKLHTLACKGSISMQEAQKAVSGDWIAAYLKYVGPLPTQ
ncbi:hypothetical protein [Deinococcus sp.]|uniref:hypothetical protein n=1 Tax=Deinococcus sp. TaxID=47478 RepID=UPI003CC64336